MEITRTANAGVLLRLDGVTILMDGVCREVKPYPATPPEIKETLLRELPDAVAFTHAHKDHYDPAFASAYQQQTSRVIFGPADCHGIMEAGLVQTVRITPVPSRHIGAAGKTTSHTSFILEGSKCVWFLGDASPLLWKDRSDLPNPDVLIVPYAYATTPAAWEITKALNSKEIVLLHLPERKDDSIGLWDAVEATVEDKTHLHIPALSETIYL